MTHRRTLQRIAEILVDAITVPSADWVDAHVRAQDLIETRWPNLSDRDIERALALADKLLDQRIAERLAERRRHKP